MGDEEKSSTVSEGKGNTTGGEKGKTLGDEENVEVKTGGPRTNTKYSLLVLVVLMLVYMFNQFQAFCLVATNNGMAQEIKYGDRECVVHNQTAVRQAIAAGGLNMTGEKFCSDRQKEQCDAAPKVLCYWKYLGRGNAYQLLAGPLYIVLFAVSGIPMGLVSELNNINRKWWLAACVVLWSVITTLGAFTTAYWHLAITRLLLGVFSAACVPFCASIISDYFTPERRGAALGFYNWGVYVGYSLTFLLVIAERNHGWRAVYLIAGIPGIIMGIVLAIVVRDPPRDQTQGKNDKALTLMSGTLGKLKASLIYFVDPSLLLLCLGGALRNGAGLVWAYNIKNFFDEYHPGTKLEAWMSWVPLIFGSIGAFGGGFLSDKLSMRGGTSGRMYVLIGSVLLSAPFTVGTLMAPMPWTFVCHMCSYVIGEMWIGVCVAVVIDLVPSDLTTSAVAVYFFIIQIIGGNMNLIVTPITKALELKYAVMVGYTGLYVAGGLLFVVTLIVIKCRKGTTYDLEAKAAMENATVIVGDNKTVPNGKDLEVEVPKDGKAEYAYYNKVAE